MYAYTCVCVYVCIYVCMQLSLGVECVEVILESEGTQRSRGYPVLACNVTALVQVSEWTGDVSIIICLEGGGKNGGEERMEGRKGWRGGKDGGEE